MPKKKSRLTPTDKRIFASVFRANRPLSIRKIAKRTDISWQTANTHIKNLKRLGVLQTNKSIRRANVRVDSDFERVLRKLREKKGF